MARLDPTVWERLDYRPTPFPNVTEAKTTRPAPKKRRWRIALLDAFSVVVWLYGAARVFVGDFDRWLIEAISPRYAWLLDYRFFGFLALLSLVLIVLRRRQAWIPVYVVVFPLVVIFWKVPHFLYMRRSMTLFIGFVHAATAMLLSFKRTIVALTLEAFAILGVALSHEAWLLGASAIVLLVIWFASLGRGIKYALAPTRFVRQQRSLIERFLDSTFFWGVVTVGEDLAQPKQERLTPEQTNQFLSSVSYGLLGYRLSQFWARRLDDYRRSSAFIVFAAVAVLSLFLLAAITFTGVNVALFRADPAQFRTGSDVGLLMFAYYSVASMFASEIAAIVPVGSLAAGINIVAIVSSAVVLFLVVASLIFGYRQSKSDESATREIELLRKKGDAFALRLADEYDSSLEAIAEHLRLLGYDLLGIIG